MNGGLSVDDVSHLGFYQHLAFRSSAVLDSHLFEESEHCTSSWRMPTSARNRFIYFISKGDYGNVSKLMDHLLNVSDDDKRSVSTEAASAEDTPDTAISLKTTLSY